MVPLYGPSLRSWVPDSNLGSWILPFQYTVADLRHETLLKKRFGHKCFPVSFAQFLRTLFLRNTYGRLPLYIYICICLCLCLWLFSCTHCMKSVQILSFFWSVFCSIQTKYGDLPRKSPYSVRILENTDQKKLCIWTLFTQRYFWWWFSYSVITKHRVEWEGNSEKAKKEIKDDTNM